MKATPATLRLAAAWATLACAPPVAGGLWPEGPWPLADALELQLALAVTVLPLLWAGARPALHGSEGARERALQGGLLVCVSVGPFALSSPFAPQRAPALAAAALYALCVLGAVGLLLALVARRRERAAWSAIAAWVLGGPLLSTLAADLTAGPRPGATLLPLLVVRDLLAGAPPLLPCGELILGALSLAVAVRLHRVATGRIRASAVAPLAAAAAALGVLASAPPALGAPTLLRARAPLGDRLRPGEPYPLLVWVEGLSPRERVAAQSFGHRWEVPASPGPLALPAQPVGGGRRLTLWGGAGERWVSLGETAFEPRPVSEQRPLVGRLGAGADALARRCFPARRAECVDVDPADLPLLARAGQALDVLVVGERLAPEALAPLRAWTAAGGVLVLADPSDLDRVCEESGEGSTRRLGAGLALGLDASGRPDASTALLERRLRGRARRRAVEEAVAAGPRPEPGARTRRRTGLAALGVALTSVFLLCALGARVPRTRLLGGAALAAAALVGGLRPAVLPAGPVYVLSGEVLEAPAGRRTARRFRYLRCAAVRPARARLRLRGPAPPLPVFASPLGGARLEARVLCDESGALLDLPLRRETRTFVRLDAVDLGGRVELTRGRGGQRLRVRNGSRLGLRDVHAVVEGGLYRLGALPAGGETEFDLLARLPFDRWRAGGGPYARAWRELVTASLSGRDLSRALLLFGRADAPAQAEGRLSERSLGALVVVVATPEEH